MGVQMISFTVLNKAYIFKLIHEKADPRTSCPHHLSQGLLHKERPAGTEQNKPQREEPKREDRPPQ